jgi:hypothetical protein
MYPLERIGKKKEENMATKKAGARKSGGSKTASKGRKTAGDQYTCETCGLGITVDEECCCVNPCDLVCCDSPMKKRRSKK